MQVFKKQLDKAENFLSQRVLDGAYGLECKDEYRKYTRLNGKGQIVSACFVAEALRDRMKEPVRTTLLVRILSEEISGLWGYTPRGYRITNANEPFLVDADDTAFAIRAMKALEVYKTPKRVLTFFNTQLDAFSTFKSKSVNTEYSQVQNEKMHFAFHPEVNANVLTALHGTDFEKKVSAAWVNKWQNEMGFFESYFYPGHFYSTATFVNYLRHYPEYWFNITKAADYMAAIQNKDGSWGEFGNAAYTAWALMVLYSQTAQYETNIRKAVEYLASSQNEDGSWQNNNVFWQFYNTEHNVFWYARDINHIITTSLCYIVISEYKKHAV